MSCLFRALASYYPLENADTVRQKICNYIALNGLLADSTAEEWVRWQENMEVASYLANMRMPSTWGGALEIQACCELFQCQVQCYNLRDRKEWITFYPKHATPIKRLFISWNGSHYEPVSAHTVSPEP